MMTNDEQNTDLIKRRWPEGAIVYQIYPRSVQDANGDGVGDLQGVVRRLDYLQDLGVNALWLSPFYPSPMADFGYDIADYCNVDPLFGTLDDFKRLLAEAQKRNIKIIVDLVPNHSSDEHAWFKESRTSRTNSKSNWYIWKDAHPDSEPGKPQPPNNWLNVLTGDSAWEWVPEREQFYLHSFHKGQPDLNWPNRDVRQAIKNVMRFWLDMGVDGFRVDAVYWMAKDPFFRNDPLNPHYDAGEDKRYEMLRHTNSSGWPAVYAYLSEMAEVLREPQYAPKDRFMVTEAYPQDDDAVASYMAFYEGIDPVVAAPFNFEGLTLRWEAGPWRRFLRTFHHALEALNPHCVASYAFGNHDQYRMATRLGDKAARSAAVMQLTLPGMIFVYYGEEIGMHNVSIPRDMVQDPEALGDPLGQGRDPARTPMQWSAGKNAGFSEAPTTWLPVANDASTRNVEAEQHDPDSFYNLYKKLMKLRNNSDALRHGLVQVLELGHPDLVGYVRSDGGENYVTLINFSNKPVSCIPGVSLRSFILSSEPGSKLADGIDGEVELLPHEAALFLQ